ncbi:MAG: C40 family peptidase [Myxococcaceae bacterium]|nr:C40 family peptidase [Myxococcaceae bacterium]
MLSLTVMVFLAQKPVGAGVEAAKALLGTPYEWGGRLRKNEGIDCMGVVLAAAERASGCGWKSYPVRPTEIVAGRLWGAPVEGLSPVATAALALERLQAGDVLMLVGPIQNPAEPAIGTLEGAPVWVWHVGLYLGEGEALFGDHHAGATVIERLVPYLQRNAGEYSGVFITRGPATAPSRCRRHAPLAPGAPRANHRR